MEPQSHYVSSEPADAFTKEHPTYTPNVRVRKEKLPPKPGKDVEVTMTEKAVAAHNAKLVAQSKRLADRVKTAPNFFQGPRGEKMLRRIGAKGARLRVV